MAVARQYIQDTQINHGTSASANIKMTDVMPIQHTDVGTNVNQIYKVNIAQTMCEPYAVCNSNNPANGAYTATCSNFPDFALSYLDSQGQTQTLVGMKIRVMFTYGVSYGSVSGGTYPTLNINGSGAIPLLAQGKTMAKGAISAGQTVEFTVIPYGNGLAYDADTNVREKTADYTIYVDGTKRVDSVTAGNKDMVTGNAVAQKLAITTSSDNTPYSQRVNADKDKSFINKLVGASFAVNQLVKNGNFANTSNWNFTSGTVSVSNGVVTLTPSQQYGWIEQPIPIRKGHQMLVIGTCKSYTNTGTQIKLRQTRPSNPYFDTSRTLSTTKTTYAFVVPIVDDTTYCQVTVQDNNTSGWGAITIENVQAIDLTQMLGSAIADRIRAMENASAGSGIAWIKSFGFFNNSYYATDEGSLQNVKPSAHKVSASVVKWFTSRNVSSQYLVSLYSEAILKPNTNYTLYFRGAYGAKIYANENIFTTIGTATLNGSLQSIALKTKTELPYNNSTRPEDGWAIFKNAQGNTVAPNFTEFYIVEEGVNADPTFSQTTSLADTELRGIPKLDANNNLYFDGDIYYPNGDVIRKYGVVDLGSLTWEYSSSTNIFYVRQNIGIKPAQSLYSIANAVCALYPMVSKGSINDDLTLDKVSAIENSTGNIVIRDTTYGTNPTSFKTAMNGVYLIYELAIPTRETVAGYSNPHTLIRKGAEEFVDDRTIALPVGHETEYAKLPDWLCDNSRFL